MVFSRIPCHWLSRWLVALCWYYTANKNVSEAWVVVIPTSISTRRSTPTTTTTTTAAAAAAARRAPLLPITHKTPSAPSLTTRLFAGALPEGYQEYGEHLIRKAGLQCGVTKEEDLTIEWKAGRIVVTIHGQVYVSAGDAGDDDDIISDDDEEEEEEDDILSEAIILDDDDVPTSTATVTAPTGVDVTTLARAINAALDDGGVGMAIAETHEIEVGTPGASNELQGAVMFEAYKGFDVICQQQDPKTKDIKQVEGRLVERNSEFTVLNIKGRMKKLKNSTVLSVKLPKAKKEKGK